ncbi:MAG: 50S ribosomal protein L18Ae [Candidatus Thorarchaeota archaeon]|nr:MAG: 50S ribosomal protein L18Ae [Candidatus Thorarchaeota archaeon]
MSTKVWRATGEYKKRRRTYRFNIEMIADKKPHVQERVLSELGSRHRVKRREITIAEIEEIKPEELTNLELRRLLGVESEV